MISVVVPFYNAQAYLDAALAGVRSQTFRDVELILVDDGSTPEAADAAREIAARHDALLVRQDNAGPAAARNRGAAQATGHYLAFLDADDIWATDKLALQHDALERDATKGFVLSDTSTVDEHGSTLRMHALSRIADYPQMCEAVLAGKVISFTSSLFMRRSAFEMVGGFNETMRYREDQLLLLALAKHHEWARIERVLSSRRVHGTSYTALDDGVRDPEALFGWERRFAEQVRLLDPAIAVDGFIGTRAYHAARRLIEQGRTADARRMAMTAMGYRSSRARALVMLGLAALPGAVARRVLGPRRRLG